MNLEFFEFQQQLFDLEFLSMNCEFTCKKVG